MLRSNSAMILLVMFMLPFLPPEVFSWQFLLIVVSVLAVSFSSIAVFVRIAYGHWPK